MPVFTMWLLLISVAAAFTTSLFLVNPSVTLCAQEGLVLLKTGGLALLFAMVQIATIVVVARLGARLDRLDGTLHILTALTVALVLAETALYLAWNGLTGVGGVLAIIAAIVAIIGMRYAAFALDVARHQAATPR